MVNNTKEALRQKMDIALFHMSNRWEAVQVYTNSYIQTMNHKLHILYSTSVQWVDNLEWNEKILAAWENASLKAHEIIELLRSQGINIRIANYIGEIRTFLHSEVSKQAMVFGFAGLVTGGVIGLCIGYRVKSNSSSSLYLTNGSNSLMRAILSTNSRRGIDGITVTSVPVPSILRADEILVQVKAIGLDNIDVKVATGYSHILRRSLGIHGVPEPFIMGRECSGVVLDIGRQVTSFEVNDRVWVCVPIWSPHGVMSEYVVVSESCAGHKPKNIGFEGAATLPYASCVVWREVVAKAQLGPHSTKNKRVLIHLGATSKNDGVGLLATQVLKTWGARITISTEENDDREYESGSAVAQMTFLHSLKSLGAESHLIIPNDYSQLPNLTQRIFDVVVNTDTSRLSPLLANFCKDPNGDVIETFPPVLPRKSGGFFSFLSAVLRVPYYLFLRPTLADNHPPQAILNECKKLVETGVVVPVVAKSFLVSQYDQAFRHVASTTNSALAHAHIGKSVLVFKTSSA